MSRAHIALALALAVTFGVTKPTLSPLREVPLSKSDILLADNTSGQESAKMGQGAASSGQESQAPGGGTKSDKMSGSSSN
jgi:hypothetical protein